MNNLRETYFKVADKISKGFCKWRLAESNGDEVSPIDPLADSFCIIGGIMNVCNINESEGFVKLYHNSPILNKLEDNIPQEHMYRLNTCLSSYRDSRYRLVCYNNHEDTTKDDIVNLLLRTAESLKDNESEN